MALHYRGKFTERFYLGIGALAALALVHEFARFGLTQAAIVPMLGAAIFLSIGGFTRHYRKLTEFKERFPGWKEYDFPERRWFSRRWR